MAFESNTFSISSGLMVSDTEANLHIGSGNKNLPMKMMSFQMLRINLKVSVISVFNFLQGCELKFLLDIFCLLLSAY